MNTKAKRRIKIDWQDIAEQTGFNRGILCRMLGNWVVKGDDTGHIAIVDPPETAENETLRIEGDEWVVYDKEEA